MSVATIAPLAEKTNNFLVPNFTFVVELIAFAVIVFVLGKYVIPPINKAMADRQDAIRKQFADLDEAKTAAKSAEDAASFASSSSANCLRIAS